MVFPTKKNFRHLHTEFAKPATVLAMEGNNGNLSNLFINAKHAHSSTHILLRNMGKDKETSMDHGAL